MRSIAPAIAMACLFALMACVGGQTPPAQAGGDTLRLKYSTLLSMVERDGHVEVSIADPWHEGKTLHRYVLVRDSLDIVKPGAYTTVVKVPLRRCIPLSTVYAALMVELGSLDAVAAIADRQYVKTGELQRGCAAGTIGDVGNSSSPDIERIVSLSPDAILASPFENSGGYGKIEGLGIPIIECADYMEPTALGRAEWIKLYGMLLGEEARADSIFAIVDSSYNALKALARKAKERKSMVMDKMYGSVWYVPGGKSTIGSVMADANIDYVFAGNGSAGSVAMAFEAVLDKGGKADLWAMRYGGRAGATYKSLLDENKGYGQMAAFGSRQCYGCNVEQTLFFEETPFRPDYLLADFVLMAYPELMAGGKKRYFHKLGE